MGMQNASCISYVRRVTGNNVDMLDWLRLVLSKV